MSRAQLALNVSDIDASVDFYSKLFGTEPAKRRTGYANFAIAEPPLKLVLIENQEARPAGIVGALNHLGVEVDSSAEVTRATDRLTEQGLAPLVQKGTTCCHAVQDKAWVSDPDGAPWEFYVALADAPEQAGLGPSPDGCLPSEAQPISVGGSAAPTACC